MRLHSVLLQLGLAVLCVSVAGCDKRPAPDAKKERSSRPYLVELSVRNGLDFVHEPGPIGWYSMPQIMGSGGALFDFDGDGDLDVLLVNGGALADAAKDKLGQSTGEGAKSRLYRQETGGAFVDVTEKSGLTNTGYGMGTAVGDIDNDGDLDVYVTNYGLDRLFRNGGDGTFLDITEAAGIANPQWGTAACFFDFDLDGWLDLFVANYVDYFPGSICEDGGGRRDYCGPESFQGSVDKLYRNLGPQSDGTSVQFADVTVSSGIAAESGRGLGVLCRDFNGDRRPDIFVANDMEENFLWIQQRDGTFRNEALWRGAAVNRLGEAEANMGVVSDDLNNDSYFDLFVTHLRDESNTLFLGDATGHFLDKTPPSGLATPSLPYTGFGVASADLEHDGDLDLMVVNGRVKRGPPLASRDTDDYWNDYAEPNQVFLNNGAGIFVEDSDLAGSLFCRRVEVSRGLLSGDVDNDGDVDLLVTNCAGPARLYINEFPKKGNWLEIRAIDPLTKRDAFGSKIGVATEGKKFQREVNPSSSYLSSNDPRVHIGLGMATQYDSITVDWPGLSTREVFPGGEANQFLTLVKGTGMPEREPPSP